MDARKGAGEGAAMGGQPGVLRATSAPGGRRGECAAKSHFELSAALWFGFGSCFIACLSVQSRGRLQPGDAALFACIGPAYGADTASEGDLGGRKHRVPALVSQRGAQSYSDLFIALLRGSPRLLNTLPSASLQAGRVQGCTAPASMRGVLRARPPHLGEQAAPAPK